MAEIPDRVPGGVILASYANTIRDRTAQRYVDPTARDASNPLPIAGELAYIQSLNVLQVFDGTLWVALADEPLVEAADLALSDRLDLLETTLLSPFTATPQSLSQTPAKVAEVTIPTDGEYFFLFNGAVDFDIQLASGLSLAPIGAQFRIDGALTGGEDLGVWGDTGEGKHATALSLAWATDVGGVLAGQTVEVWLDVSSASVISPQVRDYILRGDKLPAGTTQPPE